MSTNQNDNFVRWLAGRDLTITNNLPLPTQDQVAMRKIAEGRKRHPAPATEFIESFSTILDRPASEFGRT